MTKVAARVRAAYDPDHTRGQNEDHEFVNKERSRTTQRKILPAPSCSYSYAACNNCAEMRVRSQWDGRDASILFSTVSLFMSQLALEELSEVSVARFTDEATAVIDSDQVIRRGERT